MFKTNKLWFLVALLFFLMVVIPGCAKKDTGTQKRVSEVDKLRQDLETDKVMFEKEKEEFLQELRQQQAQVEQIRTELAQQAARIDSIQNQLILREAKLFRYRVLSWIIFAIGLGMLVVGIVLTIRMKSVQVVKEVIESDDIKATGVTESDQDVGDSGPVFDTKIAEPMDWEGATQPPIDESAPEVKDATKPRRSRKPKGSANA